MIDNAEVAVQRCRRDPDPDGDLARACGSLVSRYLALDRRVQDLPASAATRRVHELLSFHLQIVAQASMLAFRRTTSTGPRSPRISVRTWASPQPSYGG